MDNLGKEYSRPIVTELVMKVMNCYHTVTTLWYQTTLVMEELKKYSHLIECEG